MTASPPPVAPHDAPPAPPPRTRRDRQHTLARPVELQGQGLFTGGDVTVRFKPAQADHGVVFVRTDEDDHRIPALVHHVRSEDRRTTLADGSVGVATCEHCLSAVAALELDNLLIEVDGPELPGFDGSASPYYAALAEAGREPCGDAARQWLEVREPVVIQDGEAMIAAMPSDREGAEILYELDYTGRGPIGRQIRGYDLSADGYGEEIAPARTFLLEQEAIALRAAGVGAHHTPASLLVIGDDGPLAPNRFRFDDEPVRHKILDLIGDLSLLGAPLKGRIIARRSGHRHTHRLVAALLDQFRHQRRERLASSPAVIDIRRITRIMPHRYPMLLVDRVVELSGDQRIVGVKNVTVNEPFFQGHYPGTPIMPGVLIVEAMAQLSGLLISQVLEHRGKIPVLLSLDGIKLRKPVTPGDQLVMEAEAIRVRSRIAHMKCQAFVGREIAAEGEVKFMLVADEQE